MNRSHQKAKWRKRRFQPGVVPHQIGRPSVGLSPIGMFRPTISHGTGPGHREPTGPTNRAQKRAAAKARRRQRLKEKREAAVEKKPITTSSVRGERPVRGKTRRSRQSRSKRPRALRRVVLRMRDAQRST